MADGAGCVSATRILFAFRASGFMPYRSGTFSNASSCRLIERRGSSGGLLISLLGDTVVGVLVDRMKFHSILDDLHPWLGGILNDFFSCHRLGTGRVIPVPNALIVDVVKSLSGASNKKAD